MTEIEQDTLGGFDFDVSKRKWPAGSVFANEGERLYRLVREHRPRVIVEVGTLYGCSTSHLALGCKHNDYGMVYSIDNCSTLGFEKTGSMIPQDLLSWIKLIKRTDAQGFKFTKYFRDGVDMLVEDGSHSPDFTRTILKNCKAKIVAVHDYSAEDCKREVPIEASEVLGEPDEIFHHPPSDCGLAIWIK